MRGYTVVLACQILLCCHQNPAAFSTSPSANAASTGSSSTDQPVGNILILDHLNINHEKGRHDWLKAFYFDFLNLVVDPRKQENLEAGRKTVWANIGAHQFHLPEGKPDAQVLDGVITLSYPSLVAVEERLEEARQKLSASHFDAVWEQGSTQSRAMRVTDPWGTTFRLVEGLDNERDPRGRQPGQGISEGLAMRDLTIYTPVGCNMAGIARFYQHILKAPILEQSTTQCVVSVGPRQTLSFVTHPQGHKVVQHEDLRDDFVEPPPGFSSNLSNYGPHVSIYVADLAGCYKRAQDLGITYVNPRFKRRAYTLEQAMDDCMFRILDIKDPAKPDDGVILQLEHEIRSVVKRDGTMYKSCPFDEIPDACRGAETA